MPGVLDLLDRLDEELLRLKVAGTSIEPLINARAITHELRRMLGHQDETGKMLRLERPVTDYQETVLMPKLDRPDRPEPALDYSVGEDDDTDPGV